jgi:hypothetical protein
MSDCRVYIVLATHQGEAFLPELLLSIRGQSHRDWTLLVRDDQSSDGTRRILSESAAADQRIVLLDNAGERLGAAANFGRLLLEAQRRAADFVFLADQDDVWHVSKIALQLQKLQAAEARSKAGGPIFTTHFLTGSKEWKEWSAKFGTAVPATPRLLFCDAAVVDAAGRPLHGSFMQQNRLPYLSSNYHLATLLGRCFVLGCTAAVNRALLDFALPLPESIASHDWWLALCAAVAGEIDFLNVPLLDYRRHGANASQPAIWNVIRNRGRWQKRWEIGMDHFTRSLNQARALRDRLRERQPLVGSAAILLDDFCRVIDGPNRWRRVRQLHRLGVPRIGFLRRLIYDLCMLK